MLKYLGFTRSVIDPETRQPRTETIYVPVEIPDLSADEGWKLIGGADTVRVATPVTVASAKETPTTEDLHISALTAAGAIKIVSAGDSFTSPMQGTAKLVRTKSTIFIAYRKGNKMNETSPNSVCIGDYLKAQFFSDCKRVYGSSCDTYKFTYPSSMYDFWSKKMDEEYTRQLKEVNRVATTA